MRLSFCFLLCFSLFNSTALAQVYFDKKSLAFAQVAAGGTIRSIITVANVGTRAYTGQLSFLTGNTEWNPLVDGARVTGGRIRVEIPAGETYTYTITDDDLTAGAAAFTPDDLRLRSSLEGNLTYHILESGEIRDSVGVQPAKEFLVASLPFDHLSSVGLALANGDFDDLETATILLRLVHESGAELASRTLTLAPLSHRAQFLSELFPWVDFETGRLEIQSDIPIGATALKLESGELSALPISGAGIEYRLRSVSSISVTTGEALLWSDGMYVKGYLRLLAVDGKNASEPLFAFVHGYLIDSFMRLVFWAPESLEFFGGESAFFHVEYPDFQFTDENPVGDWTMVLTPSGRVLNGEFQLTKRN